MIITQSQWASLVNIDKSFFRHPEKMQFSIVRAADQFISLVGIMPQNLCDWRDDRDSQHIEGTAIDLYFNGADPLEINQLAFNSKLFSGIGLYWNDRNVASHHFDRRPNRTVEYPAKWGCFITHPYDEQRQEHVAFYQYTTIDNIIGVIKKKLALPGLFLVVCGFVLYLLMRK